MEQGRVAAAHMFGEERGALNTLFPYGVYTIPEVSTVGLDEASAAREGYDTVTGVADYQKSVRSVMLGAEQGLVKLVVDKKSHHYSVLQLLVLKPLSLFIMRRPSFTIKAP